MMNLAREKARNHGDDLTLAISVNKARLMIRLVIEADNKAMSHPHEGAVTHIP